tara:strand:- start:6399 stop:7562 length:1164 start_codon:yes stop_codon:yes gene_type:complete
MALLSRKRLLMAKIEGTYGTDPTVAGTDAVLVSSLEISPVESETVGRDIIREYLGTSEQLLSNTRVNITFEAELAGSGTAGSVSKLDALFRSCGFAAATTGSAITGTAQSGGAGTITLASGASSADDYYNGMAIAITSGTGNGHKGLITDYVGSSKVATVIPSSTATFVPGTSSGYSISANVNYKPLSTSFESCTLYFNNSGILHKATGCRGTFSFTIETSGIPKFQFNMTGIYNSPTDTSAPSTTYSAQSVPVLAKAGNTVATSILGYQSAAVQSLSFDIANEVTYRDLIGTDKSVLITNREPTGEASIELPTIAAKDYYTLATSDTTSLVAFQHGVTAGNIFSFVAPTVDLGNPTLSDSDGIQMISLPLNFLPNSGNDECVLTFQ